MASSDDHPRIDVATVSDKDAELPEASGRRLGQARMLGWLRASAAILSAVLTTIWVFRDVLFRGRLPGDIGDARWTIALHEHWYQVWRGQESIRDLHFFYPLAKTLGTSDAFLVQGQLYSIPRALGIGLVDSWVIAQVLFFLLGAIGVAVLGKQVLSGVWTQVAFVVLTCASYAVLAQTTHLQLNGLLSCSWIFVGLHNIAARRNIKGGLALVVIVPPVLAMSSWYAFVLVAIVLAFLGVFVILVSSARGVGAQLGQVGSDLLHALRSLLGIVLIACFVAGWAFVLWVYLPSRSLLPDSSWAEVVLFSPRLSDIVNASARGGGIWSPFYDRVFDATTFNPELALGFTPILLGAFLLAGLIHIRSALLGSGQPPRDLGRPGRSGLVAVWFTVIAVLLFFLIDERGVSLYRFFWFHVPGLESIRSPFRVQTLLFGLAAFVVLRTLELLWARSAQLRSVGWRGAVLAGGAVVLVLILIVENQRPIYESWTRTDLLAPALQAEVDEIRNSCDAVMLIDENSTDPSWVTAINAVMLSTISGVPTPQGYSRADPIGHPGPGADAASLAAWMRGQGFRGRLCSVSPDSVQVVGGS